MKQIKNEPKALFSIKDYEQNKIVDNYLKWYCKLPQMRYKALGIHTSNYRIT